MLKICKMTSEHINEAAELEKICFAVPWTEKMLSDELKSPISRYFAAEEGGMLCGYAGMYVTVDTANITNVAVKPEKRRKGIGNRLLKAIINEAGAMNLSFITLEVRESNTRAIALYEKNGFKTAGKRKKYYSDNNEDALIMTLELLS